MTLINQVSGYISLHTFHVIFFFPPCAPKKMHSKTTMSAFNLQLQERTDEFHRLLCDVSQKLVENEVTQIEYLKYMYTGTKRTGIELLIELEKRGVFSPTYTEPLVKLLEDIKRHDIAKYIRDEYQTKYPDENDM